VIRCPGRWREPIGSRQRGPGSQAVSRPSSVETRNPQDAYKQKVIDSAKLHQQVAAVTGKGSPYSTAKHRVPEPAGDVSHKPSGRLPLLSTRPAVTLTTLKRAATISLLGEQRHDVCKQFA